MQSPESWRARASLIFFMFCAYFELALYALDFLVDLWGLSCGFCNYFLRSSRSALDLAMASLLSLAASSFLRWASSLRAWTSAFRLAFSSFFSAAFLSWSSRYAAMRSFFSRLAMTRCLYSFFLVMSSKISVVCSRGKESLQSMSFILIEYSWDSRRDVR